MQRPHLLAISCFICALVPSVSWSDPPAHAPARGHRAKHVETDRTLHSGVEIVFDSGRGVHVVVGLPGLFFHEGSFYRHDEQGWHVSSRHDRGWKTAKAVPSYVVKARGRGPAKHRTRG